MRFTYLVHGNVHILCQNLVVQLQLQAITAHHHNRQLSHGACTRRLRTCACQKLQPDNILCKIWIKFLHECVPYECSSAPRKQLSTSPAGKYLVLVKEGLIYIAANVKQGIAHAQQGTFQARHFDDVALLEGCDCGTGQYFCRLRQ